MRSRVFVSCGQHKPEERAVTSQLKAMLEARGFDVYVAIDAQTILEINSGILRELKNSDCYLLINFRREPVGSGYRGSLFSHQELAIAYALGFERILVVHQVGVHIEGMLAYIGVNTESFDRYEDCCEVVERAVLRAAWDPSYTRRLLGANLRFSPQLLTFGHLTGYFLYLDILNGRPDSAALETTARLCEIDCNGKGPVPSAIRSPLKASGRPGFAHTIFPRSHETFDLLCVGRIIEPVQGDVIVHPQGVYLNSALDLAGAGCIGTEAGLWRLAYEVIAIDFPTLSVSVELDVRDWEKPRASLMHQEAR
ncbi:MAG: hypothetical protein SFV54_11905 [Bryobacteraceae bacterium]|nr:hypothetical protein [Bryobacteraceae bacterium]